MQPSLSSAADGYCNLQSHSHSFPLSYDEQFTLAAAYLASLHPPLSLQPSHMADAHTQQPPHSCLPSSSSSSSLFDSHVHNCLASLHWSAFAASPPPQPYQHVATVSELHTVASMRREVAADNVGESAWQCPPHIPLDSTAHLIRYIHNTQQEQSTDTPPSAAAATTTVSTPATTGVVLMSTQPSGAVEPLSVSPSHYPPTRLESASQCSTDSVTSSYHSSLSSVQSPLSPVPCNPQPTTHLTGSAGQYGSHSAPPSATPFPVPPTSPTDVSEQPIVPLRLPSFIYPTVQSAINSALQTANSSTDAVFTISSAAEKRKRTLLFDSERRLKHRVIDANCRRRETVLLERFAQLSGQRDELMTRDRVSTLEVACDRYEELTRTLEAMQAKMRYMEQRLHTLDDTAAVSEQPHSKRKAAEGRRTARKQVDVQYSPVAEAAADATSFRQEQHVRSASE